MKIFSNNFKIFIFTFTSMLLGVFLWDKINLPYSNPEKKNHLPLKLISSNIPTSIKYVEKKGSAQIISAVALAALNSFGETEIIQEKESRDHTQIFLKKIGSKINIKKKGLKNIIQIMGKKKLNNFKLEMPGDPSSAAFFTALTILNDNE